MSVGLYFTRSVLTWFVAFSVLAGALTLAWLPRLDALDATPAPWSLFAPLFALAVFVTWRRARVHGEDVAAAVGGSGPRTVLPVLGLGLVLQLALVVPGGTLPVTHGAADSIQQGLNGELFAPGTPAVVLYRDGRVEVFGPGAGPPGFAPRPHNPQRYRRQAFFLRAPRLRAANDLDPNGLKWLFAALAIAVPALLLRVRDPRWWGCAWLPVAIPLLLL